MKEKDGLRRTRGRISEGGRWAAVVGVAKALFASGEELCHKIFASCTTRRFPKELVKLQSQAG